MKRDSRNRPDAEPAVHRTEPEEAADEGYPIDEIEQGTEWVPPKGRRLIEHQASENGKAPAADDHQP